MSNPLSLDTVVRRTVEDEVVTRSELKNDAGRPAVRTDLAAYFASMDVYGPNMTAVASDAYARAKTTFNQDPANNAPAALQILRTAAAEALQLPAWVPANFNWDAAIQGARAMALAQGESEARIDDPQVNKLLFMDADLTFLNSSTPTLLIKAGTENDPEPVLARYPDTAPPELRGRVILLGGDPNRDTKAEMARLRAEYPQVDWNSFKSDYREFGSFVEILRTQAIPEDIERMKRSDSDPTSRDYVITARSAPMTWIMLDEWLHRNGVDIDTVFAVNTPKVTADVCQNAAVSSAQKKALTIAAAILMHGGPDRIGSIEFRDDTDSNLFATMELLPKMFPTMKMRFYDVVHTGDNQFEERLVAFTNGISPELINGQTYKKLSLKNVKDYNGGDAPFPVDPIFRPVVNP